METFGFIGCGNMGGTLCRAIAKKASGKILVSDHLTKLSESLATEINAKSTDNDEIARTANFIFLGVKPQVLPSVLDGLSDTLKNRKDNFVLVSMAAGVDTKSICKYAKGDYPVIRIMPNTPAAIGSGMILYCTNGLVSENVLNQFTDALSEAGMLDSIPENLIDAASAVSGCGPAFVYMFIEALADGAVKCGLPRQKAIKYAAQTVMGAGKMILETGKHPGELKDAVCSPAGSTIVGVEALEASGFRNSAIAAVTASYKRTKELGK